MKPNCNLKATVLVMFSLRFHLISFHAPQLSDTIKYVIYLKLSSIFALNIANPNLFLPRCLPDLYFPLMINIQIGRLNEKLYVSHIRNA